MSLLFRIFMIVLICASILSGCASKSPKPNAAEQILSLQSRINPDFLTDEWPAGHPVNYDSVKVIDTVYVINRKGVYLKQDPDENCTMMGKADFGTSIQVIEVLPNWYGVLQRIEREDVRKGRHYTIWRWEKVYVPIAETGSFNAIRITNEDLYECYKCENIYTDGPKIGSLSYQIKRYVNLKLISKKEFLANKSHTIDFLLKDTNLIVKNGGTLNLPCSNGLKKFVDQGNNDCSDFTMHYYLGQFEFLKMYLIYFEYFEGFEAYVLFNKENCNDSIELCGYPFITPDRKHLISISNVHYSGSSTMDLFEIKDSGLHLIFRVWFTNWSPAWSEPMFMGADASLYLPVLHEKAYWDEHGSGNTNHQYLKITIL